MGQFFCQYTVYLFINEKSSCCYFVPVEYFNSVLLSDIGIYISALKTWNSFFCMSAYKFWVYVAL